MILPKPVITGHSSQYFTYTVTSPKSSSSVGLVVALNIEYGSARADMSEGHVQSTYVFSKNQKL